ncbi:hypothetical protein PIIN_05704 [Serendipita indica DSM 11827]|uniref:Uncharacterized protein n=1 Tax=Serendipita indica (strain DSM 11827) TaxID=1109443 RepID=G4TKC6_SERID|nr:hypothetical protein PIIN_05704 [Serendipita indica DSM 11827]
MQILVHSKLKKLELDRTKYSKTCDWLEYLHCPSLNELTAPGWPEKDQFIDSIVRSSHLEKIALSGCDHKQLLQLAQRLPQSNNLTISSNALSLLHSSRPYGLSKAPFPMLASLSVDEYDGEQHSLLPLIRQRYLSPRFSSSQEISALVGTISVGIVGGRDIVESPLRGSEIAESIEFWWENDREIIIKAQNAT